MEEYVTHLESLEGEALEAELENLDQNELLEILGTGLVKKAAGAIKKRFSAQGRLKAAKAKGAKIQAKTDLAKQKTSNIAAKAKMKAARAALKAANKPKPSGNVDTRKAPGHLAAEYELEGDEMSELSKKTLGSYVKSASHSAVDSAMALQRTSDKNQSRKDVEKHAGKVVRRQMGISRAANKLSKEDVEIDEIHSSKDRSHLDKAVADFTKKGGEVKKLKPGRLKGMSKAHKAIHKARESQK